MKNYEPEAVTLSVYNREANKYGVAWQTDEAGSPQVQYTTPDDTDFRKAVTVKGRCSESIGCIKNSAVLENLEKGKTYLWRVGDEKLGMSEIFSFTTLSHKKDLSFCYVADTQDVDNHGTFWKAATDDAMRRYPRCDLLVHGGDMVHMSGMRDMWQKMLDCNRECMTSYPMIPSAGNHDWWECYLEGYTSTFQKHFEIELPPQDTSYGIFFSTDVGDVHFTVLNSAEYVGMTEDGRPSPQLEWIMSDLRSADKKWKIVISHNPLFSPGKYGCRYERNTLALNLRAQLADLFRECGVDLILSGHDHVFSYTYPITGENTVQRDCPAVHKTEDGADGIFFVKPKGPVNFLPGCAGNQNRGVDEAFTPEYGEYLCDKLPMKWGYTAYSYITVKDDTLTVRYRMISAETGETEDHRVFGIIK